MTWKRRSYDAVPALSVRGRHLRRSLRLVMLSWMFGAVWLACVSGSQVKIFAEMLGFDDFAFGLMAALPFIATFGQLIASLLIERTGLVKYQFMQFALIHRALWLAVAVLGLVLPAPSVPAVVAVLAVLGVSYFTAALSGPPWMTWMGTLIPRRIRGRFFANRERVALGAMSVTVVIVGLLMDIAHDPAGPVYQPTAMRVVCGVFAVAGLCGMADILAYRTVPEILPTPARAAGPAGAAPPVRRGLRALVRDMLIEPLGNRVFRSYVLFGATLTFSLTCSGWYIWLNAMDNLGFSSLATNSLFLVVGPLAGIASARAWGRAIDRWGRRPVLLIGTVGVLLSMAPWLFLGRQTPAPGFAVDAANWVVARLGWAGRDLPVGAYLWCILACLIGGAAWPGVNVAQTSIVLGFSEGGGHSRYIAASAVLISAGGALGGLVGGTLTQQFDHLQAAPLVLGPLHWTNWHLAFLLSVAARLVAMLWLVGMPDAGAKPVRMLARQMTVNAYNMVTSRLFYPIRVVGWRRSAPRKR